MVRSHLWITLRMNGDTALVIGTPGVVPGVPMGSRGVLILDVAERVEPTDAASRVARSRLDSTCF